MINESLEILRSFKRTNMVKQLNIPRYCASKWNFGNVIVMSFLSYCVTIWQQCLSNWLRSKHLAWLWKQRCYQTLALYVKINLTVFFLSIHLFQLFNIIWQSRHKFLLIAFPIEKKLFMQKVKEIWNNFLKLWWKSENIKHGGE